MGAEVSDDLNDYVLEPFTVWAMRQFRDGNDPSRGDDYVLNLTEVMINRIDMLPDGEKAMVIIDLLTMVNAMEQVVSIMQVQAMEEAQK